MPNRAALPTSWGLRHSSHARRASAPWRAKCSATCCRQPAETTQGPCSPSTTPALFFPVLRVTNALPQKRCLELSSWSLGRLKFQTPFLGKAASRHFKDTFDLDRDIARQRAHADGAPGPHARIVPEH